MNKTSTSKLLSAEIWLISEDPLLAAFLDDFLNPLKIAAFVHWNKVHRRSKKHAPSVIVLDDALESDSMRLPLMIKSVYPEVPILFLTSRYQLKDRLAILHNGADLCLKKPFAPEELKVYLEKFLKQTKAATPEKTAHIYCEAFFLNQKNQQAHYKKEPLSLTPFVFELFWLFLHHPNQVLSRQCIAKKLWGSESSMRQLRTVDQYVRQLRKVLMQYSDHSLVLNTHHRKGYALRVEGNVKVSEGV